ncbi:MAG: glutaredoxin family protein [Bdellovibrionia bacterium]
MLLKLIRSLLGQIILGLDGVFQPKPIQRSQEAQLLLDAQTKKLSLYEFKACPFCVKVRRVIKKLGLKIELRDAQGNPSYRQELIEKGGMLQVPCLRIEKDSGEVQWLYESDDIIQLLKKQFA